MAYKAIDIARWFLSRNNRAKEFEGADDMTLLNLMRLCYYAEGCSLALDRGSLFDEDILAWEFGAAVLEIYDAYDDPCHLPFGSDEDYAAVEKISSDDKALLEEVYRTFAQYSPWYLREMNRGETPWLEATQNGTTFPRENPYCPPNGIISRDTMKDYFKANYVGEPTKESEPPPKTRNPRKIKPK